MSPSEIAALEEPRGPAPLAPRVVVVDDNDMFREGVRDLLNDYEIPVVGEGATGWEALELAETLRPDVVLMDLRMPSLDGIEAARRIKEKFPEIQVVMLTAYDDPALREDAITADASAYLIKGSDPDAIRETVLRSWNGPPATDVPTTGDPLQQLTAAQMKIQTLRRRANDPGQAAFLDDLEQAVEIGIAGLRDMMFEIKPPSDERPALAEMIRELLERRRAEYGYGYEIDDRTTQPIPPALIDVAVGIAREAVDNVRMHAEASLVQVTIDEQADGIVLEIADDGAGLSPKDLHQGSGGLAEMKRRAESVNGWCRIWSLPGAGTSVKFWAPVG
jgi:DNA-binding NarL/FixJ family response regulator